MLRCMSPVTALFGHLGSIRCLLLGVERTCRASGDTSGFDPDCVKTFFLPKKLHATEDDPRRHDGLSIFLLYRARNQPWRKLGHAERPERSHDAHNSTSSSRPDCHQERLDADDVHYAREVVGKYVQCRMLFSQVTFCCGTTP